MIQRLDSRSTAPFASPIKAHKSIAHSYLVKSAVTMKLLSATLVLLSAAASSAFAPATRLAFTPKSSSSLQMVADDAKVCLVTGSSRGLGKSIALELGKSQQKVVINYVSDGSKDAAEDTVKEIKALGGDAIAVQADST